jgi:hypothetical protein
LLAIAALLPALRGLRAGDNDANRRAGAAMGASAASHT